MPRLCRRQAAVVTLAVPPPGRTSTHGAVAGGSRRPNPQQRRARAARKPRQRRRLTISRAPTETCGAPGTVALGHPSPASTSLPSRRSRPASPRRPSPRLWSRSPPTCCPRPWSRSAPPLRGSATRPMRCPRPDSPRPCRPTRRRSASLRRPVARPAERHPAGVFMFDPRRSRSMRGAVPVQERAAMRTA